MWALLIASLKAPLALSDPEPPESFDILECVVTPAALVAAGERQRSKPLAETQPAPAYAEFIGGLTDGECALLFEHTHMLNLTDRFL
jgi:hypothetical protein